MTKKSVEKIDIVQPHYGEPLEEEIVTTNHYETSKDKIGFLSFSIFVIAGIYVSNNGIQVFYQMGYASITYLLLVVLLFFLPYTFMMTEMASSFQKHTGGIFSWMREIFGLRFSTSVTFLWFVSWIIMLWGASSICINLSAAWNGYDNSQTWHFLGLTNPETTAVCGTIYLFILGFCTRFGIKFVSKLAGVAIFTALLTTFIVIGGALAYLIATHGNFMTHFHYKNIESLFYGPNKSYNTIAQAIGFSTFVVFIVGGSEGSAGIVDKVKNPQKNLPKGMIISCLGIFVLYLAVILSVGITTNWQATFGSKGLNLLNYGIYFVKAEWTNIGLAFGMSHGSAIALGAWVDRLIAVLALLAVLNMPYILYFPMKQTFSALPKGMVPQKILKQNKHGITEGILWIEVIISASVVLALGFSATANNVYNYVIIMLSLSSTIPWSLLIFAYIKFKLNDDISKNYQFFNKTWGIIAGVAAFVALTIVNLDFIITPFIEGKIVQGIWTIGGSVIFLALGFGIAQIYMFRQKRGKIKI